LTPSTRSSAASRHRTHPHHARDLSERPKRDDVGMPPFVAGAELPNGIAHATKEPLARPCRGAFSKRCCTNNTRVLLVILSQAFVFVGIFGKPVFPDPKRAQPGLGWNDLPLTGPPPGWIGSRSTSDVESRVDDLACRRAAAPAGSLHSPMCRLCAAARFGRAGAKRGSRPDAIKRYRHAS